MKIFFALTIFLLVGNIAVWSAIYTENQRRELTVAFFDVGQGDAIFIEAPNGNQVLVDAGPSSKVLSELGQVMSWYDKSLDMIVVTNPDKDHIAGFIDVLKRYDVPYVLESGTKNNSLVNKTLNEFIEKKDIQRLIARQGMKIFLDDDVILTILFPDRDVSNEKTNDGSIVMRLIYGETEIMFTGDAPISVEKNILDNLASDESFSVQSDILKVGHHGSKTSTDESFVKAINPQYAIISLGSNNRYGHPSEETLAILSQFPIKVLRTDQIGTIVMKSNGREFIQVNQ